MKKLVFFSLSFLVAIICSAQIVQKNEKGEYRVVEYENSVWENTDIKIEGRARFFPDSFAKAIANPGQPVFLWETEEMIRLKPVFKAVVEVSKFSIIYDDFNNNKVLRVVESKDEKERRSYQILFSIASIILMMLINVLRNRKNFPVLLLIFFVLIFSFTTFCVALSFAIHASLFNVPGLIITAAIFGVFAFFLSIAVALALPSKNSVPREKFYKKLVAWYYVLILLHIIFLYIA